jgi:hypothetical protein
MTTPVDNDLAVVQATLASMTASLTTLVNLQNNSKPRNASLVAPMTLLVQQLIAVKSQVAGAVADSAAFTIGIANLTDAAVAALDLNPAKDYAAAYAVMANLLIYSPDKATALSIVDKIYTDLKLDMSAYYDQLPDGPVPVLAVNSMNAFDAVLASAA